MTHPYRRPAGAARSAFSLIELLTVIFIISLLIAILLPSLNAARNQAKRSSTAQLMKTLDAGLRLFQQDNEREFVRTNGYPPSFVHPRIQDKDGNDVFDADDGAEGRFPYVKSTGGFPRVYGAHFLAAMLVGADGLGFIQRRNVPRDLLGSPDEWYFPTDITADPIPRASTYVDATKVRLVKTGELLGRPPAGVQIDAPNVPVIVDTFDQPVLYYAANRSGSPRNMVEREHRSDSKYPDGPPYYFHQDNELFTGVPTGPGPEDFDPGWDFGNGGDHWIARAGDDLTAADIGDDENRNTFARYILDNNAYAALQRPDDKDPLRPANADSFLLISAGTDGLFGTSDDVNNLPARQ